VRAKVDERQWGPSQLHDVQISVKPGLAGEFLRENVLLSFHHLAHE
jgi:hypothetical protein